MAKRTVLKRVAYKVEPKLHVHRYAVAVHSTNELGNCKSKYHYFMNLREVNAFKESLKKGDVMEVFKAEHNFIKAWMK